MTRTAAKYPTHPIRTGLLLGLSALMHFPVTAGWLAPPDGEPIAPIGPPIEPPAAVPDEARVALGERLFHDPRLSHGDRVACAACHDLEQGGDDGRVRSVSANGEALTFNTPTVFNVALNFRLNWRGNFRTLQEHNEAVLLDDALMSTSWDELLPKLRADPEFSQDFVAAYRAPPSRETVLDALAAYQRSLATPDAPFD
ncbi:MAG: cytochrome-c peroxidase, partial [Woeseiaceae bacterium]